MYVNIAILGVYRSPSSFSVVCLLCTYMYNTKQLFFLY